MLDCNRESENISRRSKRDSGDSKGKRDSKGNSGDRNNRDPLRPVRDFLYQVRDGRRAITSLEKRLSIHRMALELNSGDDMKLTETGITEMERELEERKHSLASAVLTVSEAISQLEDINQQMILLYRYIDTVSDWHEIAEKMGMTKAAVQKLHGRALPQMEKLLSVQEYPTVKEEKGTELTDGV